MIKQCKWCKKDFNARRKSVRCCSVECKDKFRIIDIRNKKYGMLSVLNKPIIRRNGKTFFVCKCDCGKITEKEGWSLRNNVTTSCGCKTKLPLGESACRWMFKKYIQQAKSREHCFDLTLDDFKEITKKNCYYCDEIPINVCDRKKHNRSNGNFIYNGIDRKDNTKGYTKNNVVPCCKVCNSMKSKLSEKEFISHIKKIVSYHCIKNNLSPSKVMREALVELGFNE